MPPSAEPSAAVAATRPWRDIVAVALIAMVVAGAGATWWFASVVAGLGVPSQPEADGRRIAAIYDPPDRPVEAALNRGDGQLFAALATDPAVRRPEQVRGPASEQAYRYQRIGYGWLGWAASGGQAELVPWALIALVLALQPAVAIDLTWIGPEVLGTALVLVGVVAWSRRAPSASAPDGATWVAVACFAAAGLCRETLLLVPAVLVVHEAWRRRWSLAGALCLAAVPYGAWVLFLRVRVGAWPSGSVEGRLSPLPFSGLVAAIPGWATGDLVVAATILVPAVVAVAWRGGGLLRVLVAANLAFASVLGEPVWNRWPDFSRVLLPLSTLAVVTVVAALVARRAQSSLPSGNLGTWSNVPLPAPSPTLPAPTSSRTPTAG